MVNFLSTMTLIGQIISVFLILVMLREWLFKKETVWVNKLFANYGLILMLVVATMATGGSLYLSEILNWAPCKMCWLQRIFVYPQVALLLMAVWKKDKKIVPYIMFLCVIGIIFALSHYAEQISATLWPEVIDPTQPCDTTGVSCAQTYTFRFGYITIPVMAFTAMLMNLLGGRFVRKGDK